MMAEKVRRMAVPAPGRIARFYDRIAALYDWTTFFEGNAKAAALEALAPQPGERILNVGVGTGREHAVIERALGRSGLAVGVDLSRRMLHVARRRVRAPLVQADLYQLPFPAGAFDAVFCTYVLDLLDAATLPAVLQGFSRLLRPGGRVVLLTLTEGVSPLSKATMALWKAVYRLAPLACGGCRPISWRDAAMWSGFRVRVHRVVEQCGMPSALYLLEVSG